MTIFTEVYKYNVSRIAYKEQTAIDFLNEHCSPNILRGLEAYLVVQCKETICMLNPEVNIFGYDYHTYVKYKPDFFFIIQYPFEMLVVNKPSVVSALGVYHRDTYNDIRDIDPRAFVKPAVKVGLVLDPDKECVVNLIALPEKLRQE